MGEQLEPVFAAIAGGMAEPLGWFEFDVSSWGVVGRKAFS